MVIFLDKQRPPKKRMGRLQRKGSKSNPTTGVQWANWLDNPAGAPGGGGGTPALTLTSISPTSVVAAVFDQMLTCTGTGFVPDVTLMYIDGADPGVYPTTVLSPTEASVSVYFDLPGSHTISMHDGTTETPGLPLTVTAAQADPTSSWTKHAIIEWLVNHGVDIDPGSEGHFTKAELLDIVEAYLNGDPVDDLLGG